MVETNKKFVDDLGGYIHWALDNNTPVGMILFNLAHDIDGAVKGDKFMLPRTTGYSKYLPKNPDSEMGLLMKTLLKGKGVLESQQADYEYKAH